MLPKFILLYFNLLGFQLSKVTSMYLNLFSTYIYSASILNCNCASNIKLRLFYVHMVPYGLHNQKRERGRERK